MPPQFPPPDDPRPAPVLLPRLGPAPDLSKLALGGSTMEARMLAELPAPLASHAGATEAWFVLIETLRSSQDKQGLSARQLARKLGPEWEEGFLGRLLDRLAHKGDLVRKDGSPPRYVAHPYHRVLPAHIRTHTQRNAAAWEAFDLATLAFAEEGAARQWRELKDSFLALIDTFQAWPPSVILEAKADVDRWVSVAADVTPPSFIVPEDEWTAMRIQNDELLKTLGKLQSQLTDRRIDPDGGKKGQYKARAAQLEAENIQLRQRVAELETLLEGYLDNLEDDTYQQFLDGKGPGGLTEHVGRDEVERIRQLVLSTRAERRIMLAIARKLGEIYRHPLRFARLTSHAFKDHSFDSLWRARVAGYRIIYGLTRETVAILEIGRRDTVYGETVKKL